MLHHSPQPLSPVKARHRDHDLPLYSVCLDGEDYVFQLDQPHTRNPLEDTESYEVSFAAIDAHPKLHSGYVAWRIQHALDLDLIPDEVFEEGVTHFIAEQMRVGL